MTDPHLPDADSEAPETTPWGFRIVVGAAGLYLGYRLVEVLVKLFN